MKRNFHSYVDLAREDQDDNNLIQHAESVLFLNLLDQ